MFTPEPTLLDHTGLVSVAGLDGTHLGPATGLLRAEADGDPSLRSVLPSVVTPHEFFVSCLELLLAQATLAAHEQRRSVDAVEAESVEPAIAPTTRFDGAAAHLLLAATQEDRPALARLLREVGMTLLRDPDTFRLCIHPVPALDLFDVCLRMARGIETAHRISIRRQARFYCGFVTAQQAPAHTTGTSV